ncbi:MAG: 3-oxoacyl-ACP reductase [Armatimonadetes bacterium CG_4_10_14_3_um_filter_66_18]|nr:SDR family oxidoreductase [Armatimonadota bacterium]OIP03597.1 MAG: 3-oxoacyl-ACP reductase [Armatimonadetes bacterium CG2_30_66_41]PIU90971.1 MAG: 3-oxoacyl-ACP reductase [Armatimonadetes bacterium CG06_land_8_20_14_3_00_66_21]PIX47953.1 MAG: 3-oxoacyl-ACP reductase [Armatimonadetes bacterium CG_4_8_14_3_um_filter_66_20]PIY42921.1 MAG: 3-oxoacyl-ACP reductase [Armatimonadetes bacterium CG_4_10_14_3_um_filter_66_18]PIZ46462.1 MAG: 3-oxoacyl-ACP reductase [Armatimonadetes bacterium CG_4_10_1
MPKGSAQWAVILGASSGFGSASAVALARQGFDIVGVHLDRASTLPSAEKTVADIEAAGRQALFFNVDASDAKNRRTIIQQMQNAFGVSPAPSTVRVLLHSLAFGSLRPFLAANGDKAITPAQMDMTLNVMANSLVYWTQDLFDAKLLERGAKILSMTSAGSARVWSHYGAVSAAKAALESHTRQLAYELAPHGVSVNCLRAGVTDTPALRKIPTHQQMLDQVLQRSPSGRLTTVDDVAGFVAHFALAEDTWVTGNVINVDGGEFGLG